MTATEGEGEGVIPPPETSAPKALLGVGGLLVVAGSLLAVVGGRNLDSGISGRSRFGEDFRAELVVEVPVGEAKDVALEGGERYVVYLLGRGLFETGPQGSAATSGDGAATSGDGAAASGDGAATSGFRVRSEVVSPSVDVLTADGESVELREIVLEPTLRAAGVEAVGRSFLDLDEDGTYTVAVGEIRSGTGAGTGEVGGDRGSEGEPGEPSSAPVVEGVGIGRPTELPATVGRALGGTLTLVGGVALLCLGSLLGLGGGLWWLVSRGWGRIGGERG